MKTFKQFLSEAQVVSAFPISRADMPQLDDIEKFLKWAEAKYDIQYELADTQVHDIKPTQSEYDEYKVARMGVPDSPILISSDYFIVDGHHRFFAVTSNSTKWDIQAYRIDAIINRALALAKEYEETVQNGS